MEYGFYAQLLKEIGEALKIPAIEADQNDTCLLKLASGLEVQMEMHKSSPNLIIETTLGQIPPGGFRENLFREALKENGMPHPRHGDFAFSRKQDALILFGMLPSKDLNGVVVADFLVSFEEKALKWKEHIERGEVPIVYAPTQSGGMFGLRP